MTLSKKQFWNMVDNRQIVLGTIDTCLFNGIKYSIKCDDINNTVELENI